MNKTSTLYEHKGTFPQNGSVGAVRWKAPGEGPVLRPIVAPTHLPEPRQRGKGNDALFQGQDLDSCDIRRNRDRPRRHAGGLRQKRRRNGRRGPDRKSVV